MEALLEHYLLFAGLFMALFILWGICQLPSKWSCPGPWPPISDDEFMRRYEAMVGRSADRDIALRVRKIISEQLGVDYERVYPEQKFVDDLGC